MQEKYREMAKVSYDHSGSYRKESSSSYRSYTNRELNEQTVSIHSDNYRKTYRDFDEIPLSNHSQSGREYRRESESRDNRSYRSSEISYPPYKPPNNQRYQDENVHLIQPGRRDRPASSIGESDSVRTDTSKIPIGLEILQSVDRFVIRQIAQSGAWWETARFQVEDGRGKQIFEIKQEKAESDFMQMCCGKMREYFLKVYVGNQWIMELEHPWSFLSPMFCPWASPSFVVRLPTGEVLGEVKNASRETCVTCLPPTKYFEIVNADGKIIDAATGPTCYPFECSSNKPASFELFKVEEDNKSFRIGQVNHVWRGICGGLCSCCFTEEQETVTITFPKDIDVEEKALLLGLGFLVVFTFFDFK